MNSWEPMNSLMNVLCDEWMDFNHSNHIKLTGDELMDRRNFATL